MHDMNRTRILSFGFAIVAFAASYLLYLTHFWLAGFPDGFLTKLQRGQQYVYGLLIALQMLIGGVFTLFGFRQSSSSHVHAAILTYAAVVLAVIGIDAYLHTILMGGGGG